MCGRFALVSWAPLAEHFCLDDIADDFKKARYNIAPTQKIGIIPNEEKRELISAHWGLIPSWAKDKKMAAKMINARAETVAEKPSFRTPFKIHRCLIPADAFYEWKGSGKFKQPHVIRLKGGKIFAFAGLYSTWRSPEGEVIPSCTIITTEPNELVKEIHKRMPVILPPEAYSLWLSPEPNEKLHELLLPFPASEMETFPVSTAVNNVRNDSPECQKPHIQGKLF